MFKIFVSKSKHRALLFLKNLLRCVHYAWDEASLAQSIKDAKASDASSFF